jgi:hypothetical protein
MLFWFLGLRPCTEISINGSAVRPLRGEVKCSKCFVLCRVCDSTYLLEPSTQIQLGSGSAIVVGHHTSWCVLTSAAICDSNWPLYVRKKKKRKYTLNRISLVINALSLHHRVTPFHPG